MIELALFVDKQRLGGVTRPHFDFRGVDLELPRPVRVLEEPEVVVHIADSEFTLVVHECATRGVRRGGLDTRIERAVRDMIATDRRIERHKVVDIDLLGRDGLSRDDRAVETVVLGLLSGDTHAIGVQLVEQTVIALHDQLVGHDGAALDEVALDGDADERTRDMALAHHEITDDAGFRKEFLDSGRTDVGEIDVCILKIRGLSIELRNVQILDGSLQSRQVLRVEILERTVIRLKVVNIGVSRFEVLDRGILGLENCDIGLLSLKLVDVCIRSGQLTGNLDVFRRQVIDLSLGSIELACDRDILSGQMFDRGVNRRQIVCVDNVSDDRIELSDLIAQIVNRSLARRRRRDVSRDQSRVILDRDGDALAILDGRGRRYRGEEIRAVDLDVQVAGIVDDRSVKDLVGLLDRLTALDDLLCEERCKVVRKGHRITSKV